jgi:hypothetical protein
MTKTLYLRKSYQFYRTIDGRAVCQDFVSAALGEVGNEESLPSYIRLSVSNKRPHEAGWTKINSEKDSHGDCYFYFNSFRSPNLPEHMALLEEMNIEVGDVFWIKVAPCSGLKF